MPQRIVNLLVGPESDGMRLDAFLATGDGMPSRSACARLVEEGAVTINETPATSKSEKVLLGDRVRATLDKPEPELASGLLAPNPYIPLDIRFEDDHLIVLSKQAGLVCHPSPGHVDDTLANALVAHCGYARLGMLQGEERPGIVHRIDKDTSGLVLAAKHAYAAPLLARNVEKLYYAVVEGELPLGPGVIDAPIGRQAESIIGRCVTPDGKPSRTEYTILKAENGLSLAACVPVTGRTHQIRVHFASIGHPLAGDDLYGGSRERIGRQALHCARQSFRVPVYTPVEGGIRVECPANGNNWKTAAAESPLPQDMKQLFGEK